MASLLDWGIDGALPPAVEQPVFHYTSAYGLEGMLREGALRASHVAALNDPSELEFGWSCIQTRAWEFGDDIAVEVNDAASRAHQELPQLFVLSASTEPDSLSQFRLYGRYRVTLAPGEWQQVWSPWGYTDARATSAWRPVVYGAEAATPHIDKFLKSASAAIWNADAVNSELLPSVTAAIAADFVTLALHIKHPAYVDEHEARVVFQAGAEEREGHIQGYARADRVVPYVEAGPKNKMFPILGVHVGPPSSPVDVLAVQGLMNRFERPDLKMAVTASQHPYRG